MLQSVHHTQHRDDTLTLTHTTHACESDATNKQRVHTTHGTQFQQRRTCRLTSPRSAHWTLPDKSFAETRHHIHQLLQHLGCPHKGDTATTHTEHTHTAPALNFGMEQPSGSAEDWVDIATVNTGVARSDSSRNSARGAQQSTVSEAAGPLIEEVVEVLDELMSYFRWPRAACMHKGI